MKFSKRLQVFVFSIVSALCTSPGYAAISRLSALAHEIPRIVRPINTGIHSLENNLIGNLGLNSKINIPVRYFTSSPLTKLSE